jgi:urea transport system permease protein
MIVVSTYDTKTFWLRLLPLLLVAGTAARAADAPREVIARAAIAEDSATQRQLIGSLMGRSDDAIAPLFEAWRTDRLFVYAAPDGTKIPVQLTGPKDERDTQAALHIDTGAALTGPSGPLRLNAADLTAVEHTASLRRAMKAVLDLADLAAPDPAKRVLAIQTIGLTQDVEKLPALQARTALETDPKAKAVLREAIALIQLKDENNDTRVAALVALKELHSLSTSDAINRALKEAEAAFHRLGGRTRSLAFYLEYALANYRDPVRDVTLADATKEYLALRELDRKQGNLSHL